MSELKQGDGGSAQFTTTEVQFRWYDLPEDVREDFKEDIVSEIGETVPLEEIVRTVVKKEFLETSEEPLSKNDFSAVIGQCITDEQLDQIADRVVEENGRDGITKSVEANTTPTRDAMSELSENSKNKEVVDEINKRVVAPLLFVTGVFLLAASIGAAVNGSILLSLGILPVPLATAYFLWKVREL